MKKKIFVLLLMMFIVSLCGCSSSSNYYSEDYVKKYVARMYADDFTLVDKIVSKLYTDKKNRDIYDYKYVFKRTDGMTFSVHSKLAKGLFGGYHKAIEDDYAVSIVNFHLAELEKIVSESSVRTSFDWNSNLDKKEVAHISIYLDNYVQINEATELISKIDNVLSFNYKTLYDKPEYSPYNKIIKLYLKTVNNEDYFIDYVNLSSNSKSKISKDEILANIEQIIVDKARYDKAYKKNDSYELDIPQVLFSKYPAKNVIINSFNGLDRKLLYLDYNSESQGFIWNYDTGCSYNFQLFVKGIGGKITEEFNSCIWEIGNNNYKFVKKNDNTYIVKNGKYYQVDKEKMTKEDIEKIFDIKITVDTVSGTGSAVSN